MPSTSSSLSSYQRISPREVVEEMSFQEHQQQKQQQQQVKQINDHSVITKSAAMYSYHDTTSHFGPVSPPPAAPPPPPPPSDSDAASVQSVTLEDHGVVDDDNSSSSSAQNKSKNNKKSSGSSYSYGSSYQTASASRAAPIPVITNYGVSPSSSSKQFQDDFVMRSKMRGDPNLRPNTGETNDEYGGIGSLREVTHKLRWMTITSTLCAVVWEGFAIPTRLLVQAWIYPAKVVLGAYLGVFCLLMLGVELNAPLRDNFGVLYHPIGRGALLFLMSGMCFGILADWWEILLGAAFIVCGSGYFYCYLKYPEYRRWQDYNDNHIWQEVRQAVERRGIAWARPTTSDLSRSWDQVQQESQSLLHNV